ncbi:MULTISPECIES: TM2 domain-containing protein [Mammaliicoccus]|uniref:TM2 domain-containing protein n=1 Tax=Mammaliicoccus sciuri TaxID=1296 RepID=A0ABT7HZ70_MAMSC|nr:MULTISPECIES: TM2 domain-containing protein [Mammaliicoccus]MBF9298663.1 TM2 domain-containing protein [Staphylococcus schleiferi]MCD8837307.1 TM2 domain-containing protein [Mammaliicoccus sciuri]MCJ0914357.1 TM2 domain-containing protein [Mammaliicoccus sciuri]MCJ0940567.1 TM2 domain-containing protein [Mammaliicoccus sciuri]MCJ0942972.1 TM2 domain-containing protein [Mammaliicoccus sciuri]
MKVDKITYSLLAFFLGGLGIHKFYVGKKATGILHLIFCWTGIPGVIGIIQGVKAALKPADESGKIVI